MKNALRIIFAISLIFVMVFSFAACGKDTDTTKIDATNTQSNQSDATNVENAESDNATASANVVKAEIDIKTYGKIELELYPDIAPKTVENFVELTKSGFYNGLTFHRIMDGFMMQGGDPLGNGTGGSDKEIVGEFTSNGHTNNLSHTRGTISMARSQMPNSASSQFFIVHKDSTFLDGQYAAFGRVISGIEVVDKVCTTAVPVDNNGTIPAAKQPVIDTIKIIE